MAQGTLVLLSSESVVQPPVSPIASPEILAELRTQIEDFLDYATDAALQPILDSDIPFVGDVLKATVTNVLLAPLKQAIEDALDTVDAAAAQFPQAIADAINSIGGPITATVEGAVVRIALAASDSMEVHSGTVDLDIGYDALGFALEGGVSGGLGVVLDAELTFDTDTGELVLVDKPTDVLTVELEASLDEVAGEGRLGFLTVTADDKQADPEIQLSAKVDIAGGAIGDLTVDSLSTDIDGTALIRFGLAASLDGADPADPSPLPRMFTDLVARYDIVDFDPLSGLDGLGTTPTIALEDMELDVGTLVQWLGSVMQPITDVIFKTFALDKLFDAITTPIPLIDDGVKAIGLFDLMNVIDDDRINLLDMAAAAFPDSKPIIEAFSKAYNLIKGLAALVDEDGLGGGSRINFGDKILIGDPELGGAPMAVGDYLDQLADVLDDIDMPGTDGLANGSGPLSGLLADTGFSIPILETPEAIIGLFLNGLGGTPIDLIKYDVPKLEFSAGFSQFFPIVGPIGVSLYGDFGAGIDIDIGYDTAGMQNGNLAEGFYITTKELADPRVLPGVGGSTVYFDSAGYADAEIGASAGINVGIAEVSVGGGVFAGLDAYFEGATTPGDGKLRLSDLSSCMFDPIAGEFGVKVQVTFRIGIGPFSYTKRFDILKVSLANFEFGCTPETDKNHGLASLNAMGQLTLNVGDRADNRVIEGQVGVDEDESYRLSKSATGGVTVQAYDITEINGHPNAGEPTDDANLVTLIVGHMGDENDQVALDPDVDVAAQLFGEDGHDLLAGGMANDLLDGGEDDDRLIGNAGKDELRGDDGNDVLEGGAGADTIDGGDDFDQVTYENSKAGVWFRVSASDDEVFIGSGGDAQGDRVTNVEHIIGSRFDDKLYLNPDEEGVLEGLAGNDILVGSDEDDLLLGGAGADDMRGGDGDDTITFVTSASQVRVNMLTGVGSMGDANGDHYSSIENIHGSNYDDWISGDGADNKIQGWNGDDTLIGGGGTDELIGDGGDDLIYGSANGGYVDGGGSVNAPGRDKLSYERVGAGITANLLTGDGNDEIERAWLEIAPGLSAPQADYSTIEDLTGSNFNDVLTGDFQNNRIEGLNGADSINGSAGNDTLIGGAGADILNGGSGAHDLADYSASTGGVTVTLNGSLGIGGHAAGDQLISVEDLTGSRFADTLTGGTGKNRIDPGISGFSADVDLVDGAAGIDTLLVNYGAKDYANGVSGGFNAGSSTAGAFGRAPLSGGTAVDRVTFSNMERIEFAGTAKTDIIAGGADNDIISTNAGVDLIYTGTGFDRVNAGGGSDIVLVGTDLQRQLASIRTSNFGDIRGGAGIDYYGFSLGDATYNINLQGNDGTTEFWGTNFSNGTGSAISEFEVIFAAVTGFGDDRINQPGVFIGSYATGFGVDVINPGQGVDVVDGGQDFRPKKEVDIGQTDTSGRTSLFLTVPLAQALLNDGDLLQLDYRKATAGINSIVGQASTNHVLVDGQRTAMSISTNNGSYTAGTYQTQFSNIERVEIKGSKFGDEIIGTNLTYGVNVYIDQKRDGRPDASFSQRGDDTLQGNQGNDTIVGGTGDDTIIAGDGRDVIIGTEYTPGRSQPQADLGEIDTLTGGRDRDVFVLGNGLYSYYDDQYKGAEGWTALSHENRAIITDFDRGEDVIVLSSLGSPSPAEKYVVIERNGSTFIYLNDGMDAAGLPEPKANELIAELVGITRFDLKADYVVYSSATSTPWLKGDGSAAADPFPAGWTTPNATAAPVVAPESAASVADAALAELQTAAANDHAAAPQWITQTSDLATLDQALWGGKDPAFLDSTLTIEGYGESFGVFQGDPFGLGEGVIISTGRVADLAGKNLVDGGRQPAQTTELVFEDLGMTGSSRIYRANLTGLGFDINSLKLGDSGSGFGGSPGSASGFDIDSVVLSRSKVDSFADYAAFNSMSKLNVLSFTVADTEFVGGTLRPATDDTDLLSTVNGLPDFGRATLGLLDSAGTIASPGFLSMGDGGSLGLDLTETVSTEEPLYLYIAEVGGNGETINSGFTATAGRLDAPNDLSTDLGFAGGEDDTAALVYRFNARKSDTTATKVSFDFVFFSEEFAEFAQSEFNDKFKITLNGVNMTMTSSGAFGSVSTIFAPPGQQSGSSIYGFYTEDVESDYIANPVEDGPLRNKIRADGFTRTLTFTGEIDPGQTNELRIEVSDTGDGLLDSGLMISGKLEKITEGSFFIDRSGDTLREGETLEADFGIELPNGATLPREVTVTFRPDEYIDLGAGAGNAITEILKPDELNGILKYTVVDDGQRYTSRVDTIAIEVEGLDGTDDVAALTLDVSDKVPTFSYTLGDAPTKLPPNEPRAWVEAWTHEGVEITHSAAANAANARWSAVTLTNRGPTRLPGGDLFTGDLGVSGGDTEVPQELSGKEGLRFQFKSGAVDAVEIDFSRFDIGDVAIVKFYDDSGRLISSKQTATGSLDVEGLGGVQTMVITAKSGAFMVDSVAVTELAGRGTFAEVAASAFGDEGDFFHARPVMPNYNYNDGLRMNGEILATCLL